MPSKQFRMCLVQQLDFQEFNLLLNDCRGGEIQAAIQQMSLVDNWKELLRPQETYELTLTVKLTEKKESRHERNGEA